MNALDRIEEIARAISASAAVTLRNLEEIRAELARRERAAGVATADQTEASK